VQAKLSPPNSILFISDPTLREEVPELSRELVNATSTCIAVGTLAEIDGETTVRLAKAITSPEGQLVFSGEIETPGLRIAISRSDRICVVEHAVARRLTHVKVWANHPREPDLILVETR
jgi:hypothetical protein